MSNGSGPTSTTLQAAADRAGGWLPWLPPLLTVVGWALVNRQANRRELRKEQRAVLDGAKKLAVEIATKAVAYVLAPGRDEAVEGDIKAALEQLEIEINRVADYTKERDLVQAMAEFGDAATGADFESNAKVARQRSDPSVLRIVATRNQLLSVAERLYTTRWG